MVPPCFEVVGATVMAGCGSIDRPRASTLLFYFILCIHITSITRSYYSSTSSYYGCFVLEYAYILIIFSLSSIKYA